MQNMIRPETFKLDGPIFSIVYSFRFSVPKEPGSLCLKGTWFPVLPQGTLGGSGRVQTRPQLPKNSFVSSFGSCLRNFWANCPTGESAKPIRGPLLASSKWSIEGNQSLILGIGLVSWVLKSRWTSIQSKLQSNFGAQVSSRRTLPACGSSRIVSSLVVFSEFWDCRDKRQV